MYPLFCSACSSSSSHPLCFCKHESHVQIRHTLWKSLCFATNSPKFSYRKSQVLHFSDQSVEGLILGSASYVPLTPNSFLERAAKVYRDRTSVIYGTVQYTWRETLDRCRRLASALTQLGISLGDIVATWSPNVPAVYELHFGVPMAGAVLCTLNTRYDADMVSRLLSHSEAKVIFVDYQLFEIPQGAFDLVSKTGTKAPLLVLITDPNPSPTTNNTTFSPSNLEYESLLESGEPEFEIRKPKDEWDPLSLNYTSGTTTSPKGVIYNRRGSYINTLYTVLLHEMRAMPVYMWTVPMFHCNGWCLTWGLAAQGGTNVCLRKVTPKGIYDSIAAHKVTNMDGATTVLNMIVNAEASDHKPLPHKVEIMTGGSPPPLQILFRMEELGFNVNHLYGLTETYGRGTICTWKPESNTLPADERGSSSQAKGCNMLE